MYSVEQHAGLVDGRSAEESDWTAIVHNEVEFELQRVVPEAFRVNSQEAAAWVVRRIAAARRYGQQVKVWADIERRRAQHEEDRLLYMFGADLRDWVSGELLARNSKRKSIALPGGTIGFRASPARLHIIHEPDVLRWAKVNCPKAVVVTERLLTTPLVEHFERTGEVPEGADLSAPKEDFFVR